MSIKFRPAQIGDEGLILQLIQALADFEKLSHQVVANSEKLKKTLFDPNPVAHAVIAELEQKPVGFAIYFFNYSTFLAQPGLYLEDLFVLPEARSHGVGQAFLSHLAQVAVKKNCGRMEWSVLDWNQRAIDFYKRVGAVAMNDWTVFRLDQTGLQKLAGD